MASGLDIQTMMSSGSVPAVSLYPAPFHPEFAPLLRANDPYNGGGFEEVTKDARRRRDEIFFDETVAFSGGIRFIPQSHAATQLPQNLSQILNSLKGVDFSSEPDFLLKNFYDLLGIGFEDLANIEDVERVVERAFDCLYEGDFIHGRATVATKRTESLGGDAVILDELDQFKRSFKPLLMLAFYRRALKHASLLVDEYERRLSVAEEGQEQIQAVLDFCRGNILSAMTQYPLLSQKYGFTLSDLGVDGVILLGRLKGLVIDVSKLDGYSDDDEGEELDLDDADDEIEVEDDDEDLWGDDFSPDGDAEFISEARHPHARTQFGDDVPEEGESSISGIQNLLGLVGRVFRSRGSDSDEVRV